MLQFRFEKLSIFNALKTCSVEHNLLNHDVIKWDIMLDHTVQIISELSDELGNENWEQCESEEIKSSQEFYEILYSACGSIISTWFPFLVGVSPEEQQWIIDLIEEYLTSFCIIFTQ